MSELQAVFFDMDGLLVDTEPLWFDVESQIMARLGGSWGPQDQARLVGGSLEVTVSYLLAMAARPVPRDTLARWMVGGMVARITDAGVRLRPGAGELLAEVTEAGVPHALVTSAERVIMEAVLRAVRLEFPLTVCAEDVTRIKPDPEPYLLAAKLAGGDPRGCVVLEDSPNGVASARAAGCRVVAVPNVARVPPAPGLVLAASLTEVGLARLREIAAT